MKHPEGECRKRKHNNFLKKHNKMDDMVKMLEVDNFDNKKPSLVKFQEHCLKFLFRFYKFSLRA